MTLTMPASLETLFSQHQAPEALFEALLPAICDILHTDRCFLEVRKPSERLYRVFCWRRRPEFPDLTTDGWQREKLWEAEDPLYAAALRAEPSIYVEDVETAPPEVVNLDFERKNFGHRALVHAHICQDGVLYGILQPCMFGHPRVWSEFDRSVIEQVTERLRPFVVRYGETARLATV
ncbi:MAG: GAF domain-containing protein [Leptolyngbya sp. IPPAS B-1204]|nr:MAG: GAF domain-containing protein [Leptolyngbya sp. IPPAS B-1204]